LKILQLEHTLLLGLHVLNVSNKLDGNIFLQITQIIHPKLENIVWHVIHWCHLKMSKKKSLQHRTLQLHLILPLFPTIMTMITTIKICFKFWRKEQCCCLIYHHYWSHTIKRNEFIFIFFFIIYFGVCNCHSMSVEIHIIDVLWCVLCLFYCFIILLFYFVVAIHTIIYHDAMFVECVNFLRFNYCFCCLLLFFYISFYSSFCCSFFFSICFFIVCVQCFVLT